MRERLGAVPSPSLFRTQRFSKSTEKIETSHFQSSQSRTSYFRLTFPHPFPTASLALTFLLLTFATASSSLFRTYSASEVDSARQNKPNPKVSSSTPISPSTSTSTETSTGILRDERLNSSFKPMSTVRGGYPLVRVGVDAYRGIELLHVLKAGGTSVQALLREVLSYCHEDGNGDNCFEADKRTLWNRHKYAIPGRDPKLPYFRILLIREPCEYYTSLWRFQANIGCNGSHRMYERCYISLNKTDMANQTQTQRDLFFPQILVARELGLNCVKQKPVPLDAKRAENILIMSEDSEKFPTLTRERRVEVIERMLRMFSVFIRNLHEGLSIGTLSLRLWSASRNESTIKNPHYPAKSDDGQLSACPRDFSEISRRLTQPYNQYPFDSIFRDIDCWIGTHSLNEDLWNCLKRFESQAKGSVDFDKLSHVDKYRKYGKPKQSNRIPCKRFYSEFPENSEIRALISKLDSGLFRHFNFKCCQASSNPLTAPFDEMSSRSRSSTYRPEAERGYLEFGEKTWVAG